MTLDELHEGPTMAAELRRWNNDSSALLEEQYRDHRSRRRMSGARLAASAAAAFLKAWLAGATFLRGRDGFIRAGRAMLEVVIKDAKRWEFEFRQDEHGAVTPPSTPEEVEALRTKYATWTTP